MTVPDERTRAIMRTRAFLLALVQKDIKKVPKAVRDQAYSLLRHYPTSFHMDQVSESSPDTFGPVDKD